MAFLEFLHKVAAGEALSASEAEQAMGAILEGSATVPQIAAFLVGMRVRGETTDEVLGLARAMRARSAKVDPGPLDTPLIDTCGTGGGTGGTFNISTVSAFVVAGCGVRVAKHGNRSFTSHCGSADLLEALGVNIALPPERMAQCIREAGIGFLFAPALHPAMKNAAPARSELKMRTVLNLLGPLTNPAGARHQLIGAASEQGAALIAGALAKLGAGRSFVVHGMDGLDEITTADSTIVLEVNESGKVARRVLEPEQFGVPRASIADLAAPTREDNVRIARTVLSGARGPQRDIVLVNASAALVAAGSAGGFTEGVKMAGESIDSGAAATKLAALIELSR